MQNLVLIPKLKSEYGPMMQSMIKTGIKVQDFNSDYSKFDKAVVFSNDASVIKNLRNRHTKLGWWMCDLRPPEMLESVDCIDHIFLCNTEHLEGYNKKYGVPVSYMPQTGMDFDGEDAEVDWNILFIGNFTPTWHYNRAEILESVQDLGLKTISGAKFTPQNKEMYRKTPINISISLPVRGYTSNRTYNILSSGGFCLINWFPDIEKLFTNHKHLVWFKNKEEARAICKYYLENPKEREKIARQGKMLYNSKHTAKHRLDEMFSLL